MIWSTTKHMTTLEIDDEGVHGISVLIDLGAKYEYAEAHITSREAVEMARAILDHLGVDS